MDRMLAREIIHFHSTTPKYRTFEVPKGYVKFETDPSATCDDNFNVYLKIEDNKIIDAKFDGVGCAVSTAAIDIFINMIINKDFSYAKELYKKYQILITTGEVIDGIETLEVFANVFKFLNRVECAMTGPKTVMKGVLNG